MLLTFFESLKIFLINMVTIFMMSAKMTTLSFLEIKIFWDEDYGTIISVHDVTNKILTCHSNYVVVSVMWPKFGNSSISVREVIMTSILYGFDQKFWPILVWPWNLYQFGKSVKTINTSMVKALKLKVRKFSGLILTFVEVTGEKLVGGPFCPTHPHLVHEYIWIINLWNFLVSNFSRN